MAKPPQKHQEGLLETHLGSLRFQSFSKNIHCWSQVTGGTQMLTEAFKISRGQAETPKTRWCFYVKGVKACT